MEDDWRCRRLEMRCNLCSAMDNQWTHLMQDDWRCRRLEKCCNLCSAMDNRLLKINYPRTVGWLQLQEVEVAFVVVWDHSCWLHASCTGYSICAHIFVLFHLQFSSVFPVVVKLFHQCLGSFPHFRTMWNKRKGAKSLFCLHAFGNVHPAVKRHYIHYIVYGYICFCSLITFCSCLH